ncbi:variant erythrocyte surface antigen beta subunit, putative [Babesia ovis]|uniref:Variant erythrocyte surface antigen beta subunit, putative n=1 Tax=Babesia ovis TaxID=5869 RepID=A0A9W5TD40_BABOV|nr:variant erythrocyte surface antigen beta subunit, putative [Babesia ovis]
MIWFLPAERSVNGLTYYLTDTPVTSEGTPEQKPSNEMTYEEKIDRLADNSKPVPIHDLYSNSLFEFRFPMSETESYYLLQDCLVALYYQMYFLKQQCNWERQQTTGDGFGWAFCRYGYEVNGTGCGSWQCPQGKGISGSDKHGENKCGTSTSGTPSPLQAFLTDCLPGFTCSKVKGFMDGNGKGKLNNISGYLECYPPFTEHLGHPTVPGTECAVPMGFSGSFREGGPASGTGTAAAGNKEVQLHHVVLEEVVLLTTC